MPRRRLALLLALACDILIAGWLFAGPLFAGRVLYFRDILVIYYPDYAFVARWLSHGVWPLWHPDADAGAPFLAAYPLDLLLLAAGGARFALAVSPPLHVVLALLGARRLALRLGVGLAGAWLAGLGFGLSGFMLSSVLYPLFLAAAWMPLVIERFLRLMEAPNRSRAAMLGLLLAVQLSTLGAEAILQTALLALLLLPRWPKRPSLSAGGLALLTGSLLAAPVLVGAATLIAGSARGHGFNPNAALAHSTSVPVLLAALLPHFLGSPYAFTEVGVWGQPFYSAQVPFFTSLYLGPCLALLAACAGLRERRLWFVVILGLLLSLGSHGPLGIPLAHALPFLRAPAKYFLISTLGLALLAGMGLERVVRGFRPRVMASVMPGVLLLVLALAAWLHPAGISRGLVRLFPAASEPLTREVVARQWPEQLIASSSLALGVGVIVAVAPGLAPVAAVLAGLDLLRVNGTLNQGTDGSFYELRPTVKALLEVAAAGPQPARWLSYGVASSPPLHWDPRVGARNSDVWLYYLDRQALIPRTQVLDGLQGALDVDRTGFSPPGSTLTGTEASALGFANQYRRIRLANVRWIVSFWPLPEELAQLRGQAVLPEVSEPLRLYELRAALPRAFWVPDAEALAAVARGQTPPDGATVHYESPDPHTVVVQISSPPGLITVLDGFHPAWVATVGGQPVPVQAAPGRYRTVATPGGAQTLVFRYRPRVRTVGLPIFFIGIALVAAMVSDSAWRAPWRIRASRLSPTRSPSKPKTRLPGDAA